MNQIETTFDNIGKAITHHLNAHLIADRFTTVDELRKYINRVWQLATRYNKQRLRDLALELQIILIDRLHTNTLINL